jgi:aminoglycoside phosphotransferase (APT) family kinase protein
MATIGDPLADIGYLCMMWSEAADPPSNLREHLGAVTRAAGFPTRAELIARYEERSGRSMRDARWYTTLALWKSIVFMEGNYKRALAGTTDDPYLRQFGDGVLELARQAQELAHGADS